MADTTDILSLPFPEDADDPDVPRDISALAGEVDVVIPLGADSPLADVGAAHREKARALRVLAQDDAAQLVERWDAGTVAANWHGVVADALDEDAGRAYGGAGGSSYGGGMARAFDMSARGRLTAQIHNVVGAGAGDVWVALNDDAANASPDFRANAYGAGVISADNAFMVFGDGGNITETAGGPVALAAGTFQVSIEVFDDVTIISLTPEDHSWEKRGRIATPAGGFNNIVVGVTGGGAGSGPSVGQISVIDASATAKAAVAGIEDGGPKILLGTDTAPIPGVDDDSTRIVLPANYDSRVPAPTVLYFHGTDGFADTSQDADAWAIEKACHAEGWIWAATHGGPALEGFRNWGNEQALDFNVALYNLLRANWSIGPILLIGVSMGGLTSLLTLAERRIPGIVGWAGIKPATNLKDMYDNSGYASQIRTAYSIAVDGSDYDAKTAGHDPNLLPPRAFRGVPARMWASAGDDIVHKTANADAFSARVGRLTTEATVVAATGEHGDASHYDAADLVDFFKRCLSES